MTIMGIDPGPDGFAWAFMRDGLFRHYDEHTWDSEYSGLPFADIVAIEDWTPGRPISNDGILTIRSIEKLAALHPGAILIRREKIAASCGRPAYLKKKQRYGNPQVNKWMRTVYPELDMLRPLKQYRHILAACAVAHCAVGIIQARQVAAKGV